MQCAASLRLLSVRQETQRPKFQSLVSMNIQHQTSRRGTTLVVTSRYPHIQFCRGAFMRLEGKSTFRRVEGHPLR